MTGNIDPYLVQAAAQDIMQGGRAALAWLPRKGANPEAKLKAILPVDVFGQPADMVPILTTAAEFGLRVIEDSCEALGAVYQGRPAGTLGRLRRVRLLPQQADHHRRGRGDRHRR